VIVYGPHTSLCSECLRSTYLSLQWMATVHIPLFAVNGYGPHTSLCSDCLRSTYSVSKSLHEWTVFALPVLGHCICATCLKTLKLLLKWNRHKLCHALPAFGHSKFIAQIKSSQAVSCSTCLLGHFKFIAQMKLLQAVSCSTCLWAFQVHCSNKIVASCVMLYLPLGAL